MAKLGLTTKVLLKEQQVTSHAGPRRNSSRAGDLFTHLLLILDWDLLEARGQVHIRASPPRPELLLNAHSQN